MLKKSKSVLAGVALVTLASHFTFADTYTWTRAVGNNNWDSTTGGGATSNWATAGGIATPIPQTPAIDTTTDVVYSGTLTIGNTSSSLRQDYSVDSIVFAADFWHGAQATFNVNTPTTLLAGATSAHLTIGAGGITNDIGLGAGSFNVNITRNALVDANLILGADQTWTVNTPPPPGGGGGQLGLSIIRPIVGDFQVTKAGVGLLIMGMPTQNTGWTGGISINEGTVRTGGAAGENFQFGSGTIRNVSDNDVSLTASTITSAGGGGDRIFSNDVVFGGTGAMVFGGSFNMTFTADSTWTLESDKRIGASLMTTVDGSIGGNFGFTKENGGVMVLNGANTYTGVTTVDDGVLQPKNAFALGTTAGGTVIEAGGALELTGGLTFAGETLSIAGLGEGTASAGLGIDAQAGALRNRTGNNTWTGAVTVNGADAFIAVDGATTLALSGGVSGDASSSARVGSTVAPGTLVTSHVRTGGLAVDAGGKVVISADGTSAGRSNIGSLSVATAQVDITNNAAVLSAVTLADARALIVSGRNGGAWNGNGINSSTAAANPATAIGYALASSVPATAIFGTTSGTDVLVRYTLQGDADLSGGVSLDDFTALAAAFGNAGGWSSGDFNYDGVVNLDDFTPLAANFGNSLPGDVARGAVPEPTALGLVAIGVAGLLRRRRK
ncbi:MAG TPA: autotransporter-associated beta strand repeat-containing protein [Tepidisphaeraceae bacterium]|nr:autotransporter-associated beta strand repeat-containing protein [Tepidisphaeraceae bacterium]